MLRIHYKIRAYRYDETSTFPGQHYSIGARDFNRQVHGGDWRWVQPNRNSKLSYFAFGPDEPNATKKHPELCIWLYARYQYQFIDVGCTHATRYICEK
jgi:hypothetical protein